MPISRKSFLKMVGAGALGTPFFSISGVASEQWETARAEARRLIIRDVEIYYIKIPLKKPLKFALGTVVDSEGILIKIITGEGIYGIGEATPFTPVTGDTLETNVAAARDLRERLRGKDPLAIEGLQKVFGGLFHSNPSLIAAFDMALYDILGKTSGLPVFRLLGGDRTTFPTDITTGIDSPENMAAEVQANLAGGFKEFKIKVGLDPVEDVNRIQAIREAIGYAYAIRIDANQGWTVPDAINALRKMEKFDIQFCEQPNHRDDIAGMKQVRNEAPVAIMADESVFFPSDALNLIRAEACDYLNIKLMKSGGITNGLRIARLAEAANIRCMLGCMSESRIALTAAAHVYGACPNIVFADLDASIDHSIDPVVDGMQIKNGLITLPEKPGLGLDVDPVFLKNQKKV